MREVSRQLSASSYPTVSSLPKPGRVQQVGKTLWAILRQRCPCCQKGRMFRGSFAMNDPCPVCGILFQREEGTFLGAMYISYLLGSGFIFPLFYLIRWLLPTAHDFLVAFLAILGYLPLIPAIYRYSRVLWVHFERYACPSDVSATAYEKYRLQQLADQKHPDGQPAVTPAREPPDEGW